MPQTSSTALDDLLTVRDFIRYGVSRMIEADVAFGHGTTNAYDEAVFMVLEGLHLPVDQLEPYLDARLIGAEREKMIGLINARIDTRKPASYLLNRAYIQGIPFYVDERVIVPRSYIGEILCAEDGFIGIADPWEITSVLDLCTGSGCLAILAAHLFPNATIDAVDLSKDALAVAERNVKDLGLEDRVHLHHGDLFAPLKGKTYDLIITNPPYVDSEEMAALPPEYRAEPSMALDGGGDGMDIVRRILAEAPDYLSDDGGLLCEIGTGQYIIEEEYDRLPFLWLDTEDSHGEVFWITREELLED